MNLYAIALFLHITGAIGLFLGLGMEGIILKHLGNAETNLQALAWAPSMMRLRAVFGIGAVLLLLAGIYMVEASWTWSPWVITGLVLLIALSGYGSVMGKRLGMTLRSLDKNNDHLPNEKKNKITDSVFLRGYKVRFLTALGIVFIMTTKPGWIGSIAAILIAAALGILIGLPSGEKVKELESA